MINKNRENFQYRGGDLVYIISPLISQVRTEFMEDSSEICRSSSSLYNCRSSQLFVNDTGWNNIEMNF